MGGPEILSRLCFMRLARYSPVHKVCQVDVLARKRLVFFSLSSTQKIIRGSTVQKNLLTISVLGLSGRTVVGASTKWFSINESPALARVQPAQDESLGFETSRYLWNRSNFPSVLLSIYGYDFHPG